VNDRLLPISLMPSTITIWKVNPFPSAKVIILMSRPDPIIEHHGGSICLGASIIAPTPVCKAIQRLIKCATHTPPSPFEVKIDTLWIPIPGYVIMRRRSIQTQRLCSVKVDDIKPGLAGDWVVVILLVWLGSLPARLIVVGFSLLALLLSGDWAVVILPVWLGPLPARLIVVGLLLLVLINLVIVLQSLKGLAGVGWVIGMTLYHKEY